jgi:hypothetical protein
MLSLGTLVKSRGELGPWVGERLDGLMY